MKEEMMLEEIKRLIKNRDICVLATVSDGGTPHCSLMNYVTDDACNEIYMATQKTTKKFQNLKDDNSVVRYITAEALGELQDPKATESLIVSLYDEDHVVRIRSAKALGEIKDPRATGPLIAALKDEHSVVRFLAAWSLGEIGDIRALTPLVTALKDEDYIVRIRAAEALRAIKEKVVRTTNHFSIIKWENL